MGLSNGGRQTRRYADHLLYWLLTTDRAGGLGKREREFIMTILRQTSSLAVAALVSAVSLAGVARAADQAASGRYGVVDMQSVILTVEEGKTARATLEKEIKAKEGELLKKK